MLLEVLSESLLWLQAMSTMLNTSVALAVAAKCRLVMTILPWGSILTGLPGVLLPRQGPGLGARSMTVGGFACPTRGQDLILNLAELRQLL